MIYTQEKQESALGRSVFVQGAVESHLMTLGLKTAMKEETRSQVWLGENKEGRQEQSIWGPVGQRAHEERQQRCDLMCSDEEGKEQLGKQLWTKEEQSIDKDLMEGRYLTGKQIKRSRGKQKTGMGWRELETKGCTVNKQILGKGV